MKVDTIRTKKGELLILLEEDDELWLVCRADGIQIHLETRQLDLKTRKEIDIQSKELSDKQRLSWEEFHDSMEKTQTEINTESINKKTA